MYGKFAFSNENSQIGQGPGSTVAVLEKLKFAPPPQKKKKIVIK